MHLCKESYCVRQEDFRDRERALLFVDILKTLRNYYLGITRFPCVFLSKIHFTYR